MLMCFPQKTGENFRKFTNFIQFALSNKFNGITIRTGENFHVGKTKQNMTKWRAIKDIIHYMALICAV